MFWILLQIVVSLGRGSAMKCAHILCKGWPFVSMIDSHEGLIDCVL